MYIPAGTSLAPLSLQAPNALLSPLRSHLRSSLTAAVIVSNVVIGSSRLLGAVRENSISVAVRTS